MLYFVDGLEKTFLSKDALVELRVIPSKLPVAECKKLPTVAELTDKDDSQEECECPKRCEAPEPPELPKDIDKYTIEELKNVLLDHYKASTFTTCQHQPNHLCAILQHQFLLTGRRRSRRTLKGMLLWVFSKKFHQTHLSHGVTEWFLQGNTVVTLGELWIFNL